jgi:Glycosyl transferase family 2
MASDKIVLLTHLYDQGDILKDYIEWHLELGVDFVIAQDMGSSDDTHDILNSFSNKGQLQWLILPERNMLKYRPAETLAKMALEQHDAEWIIMCDADEFLRVEDGHDLKGLLRRAKNEACTAINVPCLNMTGPLVEPMQRATRTHTMRIDRPVQESHQQQLTGELPVPYVFIRHPPKTIAYASAFVEYGPGTHAVSTARGTSAEFRELRFLHYPIRGFGTLQTKVRNAVAWFKDNPHAESQPESGWHWRRWIRLNQEGQLREDYESQFVSPARAEELIRDGICTVDETVANWVKTKS